MPIQFRQFFRPLWQARHQEQRQRGMNADLVQAEFQDGIGGQVRMRLAFLRAEAPSVRLSRPIFTAGDDRGFATQRDEARLSQAEHEVAIRLPVRPTWA